MSNFRRPSDALVRVYTESRFSRPSRSLTEGKAETLLRTMARSYKITDYDPNNGAYATSPVVAVTRLVDHTVRDILPRHARKEGASSVATRLMGLEPITSKESAIAASKVLGRLSDSLGKNDRVSDAVKSGVASSQEALGHLRSLLMKNPDASKESVRDVGSLEAALGSITSVANNALSVVGAPKIKNSIHAALMGDEIPVDEYEYNNDELEDFDYGDETATESRRFRGRRMAEATEDWWPLTALSAKKLRDAIKSELGEDFPSSLWEENTNTYSRSRGLLATATKRVAVPSSEYMLLAFSEFSIELQLSEYTDAAEGFYYVSAKLRWAHPASAGGGTNGANLGTFRIDQSGDQEKVTFKAGY
jgi:hypothetical protein